MDKIELINILSDKQKTYDYSLIDNIITYSTKLPIICHKKDILGNEHGIFYSNYAHIKRGDGCPRCSGKYMTIESFIAESNKIHNGIYNYDKFIYINKKTKGIIYCPKHNIYFEQTPQKHLQGHGCPKCRYEKSSHSKTHTKEWFVDKSIQLHGNKYDYSKVEYNGYKNVVCIICPTHGKFWQTPSNHLHKSRPQGCPVCGNQTSYQEEEIIHFLSEIMPNIKIERRNRTEIPPLELDIYIPSLHLAIEHNGLYWHSNEFKIDKNYHINKTIRCEKRGIQLIHIFEDEWKYKKEIVKSLIIEIIIRILEYESN